MLPTQYASQRIIWCTLPTQNATREHIVHPTYTICYSSSILGRVGTFVFHWSSEGTQYAPLEKLSRSSGMLACFSFHPFIGRSAYLLIRLSKIVPAKILPASCLFYIEVLHYTRRRDYCTGQRIPVLLLTLNAPIATKVVCFSRLLKCFRSLYDKQCGPRSDCSYRSSLFFVHAVCFYT